MQKSEVASWKQALLAEVTHALDLPYLCSLLDLIKAFDSVPFDHLSACGRRLGYNLYLLRLSIASYLLARVLDVDGCCSAFVWASRGLAAGSVLATIELRLLLLEAGDRLASISIYCRLSLYVDDDATIETFCTNMRVVAEHSKAVNDFVTSLTDLRMQFSDTKNVVCASTSKLANAAVKAIRGIKISTSDRVVSLGTGLGAGTRRNMFQVRKRLTAFVSRKRRFQNLKRARVCIARLLRSGGIAAMTFGSKTTGVSDSMLLSQRRAAIAATRVRTCGADLDLSLMLADGRGGAGADPAFDAHCGVLHMWALAIWESWVPIGLMHMLIVC